MIRNNLKDVSKVSFFRGGLSFLKAAKILVGSEEELPADAFAYLASHSLELLLKSYLLSVGDDEDKLQEISHNLERAWQRAKGKGLGIEKTTPQWCSTLNSAYNRPFLLRYARDNTAIVVPNPKQLIVDLEVVLKVVAVKLDLNEEGNFV